MRTKTIEKILSLKDINSMIKQIISSQFIISDKSLICNDYLLIIGINEKNAILIIRASIDKDFERTYLSVLVLSINSFIKNSTLNTISNTNIEQMVSKIIQELETKGDNAYFYPFIGLSNLEQPSSSEIIKILKVETKIINLILKNLSRVYGYSDQIPKFPFSITYVDEKREFWENFYYAYVVLIEKKLKNLYPKEIEIYQNYDFALTNDIFPRIIDLVIIEKYKVKIELEQQKKRNELESEPSEMYNYIITFIYCNRNSKPYDLMNLLKFMNEIKNFSTSFKQKNKNLCNEIRCQMIIVSILGFESKVEEYLRNHLFRQTDYIIPIFVIPPVKDEVWHNFIDYENTRIIKPGKRKELEKIIQISKNQDISAAFRFSRAKTALNEYEEIVEREKIAKIDEEFLDKWQLILNVFNSKELLKITPRIEEEASFNYEKEYSKSN